jgi:hypothetical protein
MKDPQMATKRRAPKAIARTAAAGSWLALLAATTLGDGADTLHAEVRATGLSRSEAYRLVVQSYDQVEFGRPGPAARPVGSTQRAVTADELRQGVKVNLLELRASAGEASAPLVVAWIEAGAPDLEFDGRRARPQPGSMYGSVRRAARQDAVRISLDRVVG